LVRCPVPASSTCSIPPRLPGGRRRTVPSPDRGLSASGSQATGDEYFQPDRQQLSRSSTMWSRWDTGSPSGTRRPPAGRDSWDRTTCGARKTGSSCADSRGSTGSGSVPRRRGCGAGSSRARSRRRRPAHDRRPVPRRPVGEGRAASRPPRRTRAVYPKSPLDAGARPHSEALGNAGFFVLCWQVLHGVGSAESVNSPASSGPKPSTRTVRVWPASTATSTCSTS